MAHDIERFLSFWCELDVGKAETEKTPTHNFFKSKWHSVDWLDLKMWLYQYRDSHHENKRVSRLSYLYNGCQYIFNNDFCIETGPCFPHNLLQPYMFNDMEINVTCSWPVVNRLCLRRRGYKNPIRLIHSNSNFSDMLIMSRRLTKIFPILFRHHSGIWYISKQMISILNKDIKCRPKDLGRDDPWV